MNQREFNFVKDLKKVVMEKVEIDELYQQNELIELLGISRNSFRKYFSHDKEWAKKATMTFGQKKFFKGYLVREQAIYLVYKGWSANLEMDIEKVYDILAPYGNKVYCEIKTIEDYELEHEHSERYYKFGGFGTIEEEHYWELKLNDKLDDSSR